MEPYMCISSKRCMILIEHNDCVYLLQDWSDPKSFTRHIDFVHRSNYYEILQDWLVYFPLNQILIVDGNLLITDPIQEVKRAQEFLGVRDYLNASWFEFVPEKNFYCIKNSISGPPRCMGESKGRKHPEIDEKVHQRLRQYYKPYNEKLFELIGRRFNW